MNKNLISKILAISFTHLVFNITMSFARGATGSGSSIAQSLKLPFVGLVILGAIAYKVFSSKS
jgi:hypothetical protein